LKLWERGYADYSLTEFFIFFSVFSFMSYKSIMLIRNLVDQKYLLVWIKFWVLFLLYSFVAFLFVVASSAALIAIFARLKDLHTIDKEIERSRHWNDKIPR
jgi:hypothetical protein